jgi:hypothetical protein
MLVRCCSGSKLIDLVNRTRLTSLLFRTNVYQHREKGPSSKNASIAIFYHAYQIVVGIR